MSGPVVIINPGTGPVWGSPGDVTRRHADRSMRALVRDVAGDAVTFTRSGDVDDGGRYPYTMHFGRRRRALTVDMPGVRTERVRYTKAAGQNAWDFPRLYVDGSSWLWRFAVNIIRDHIGLEDL